MFPDETLLKRAGDGDLESLCLLDSMGFLPKPSETAPEFAVRIGKMRQRSEEILRLSEAPAGYPVYRGLVLRAGLAIPPEIIEEASQVTSRFYGFSIQWAPGFFPEREMGLLWGGCALSDDRDGSVPVFIIRGSFRSREKWFIYSRRELLAHELCHTARAPLRDQPLEEHFAYAVSSSWLRRKIGNCFQSELDALLFVGPVLLLLCIQIAVNLFGVALPAWPFWTAAAAYPVYLLLRNAWMRRIYFKAEKNLKEAGVENPSAVLFRSLTSEIRGFADGNLELLHRSGDLRWTVIRNRFIRKEVEHAECL